MRTRNKSPHKPLPLAKGTKRKASDSDTDQSTSASDVGIPLTFGVELEFLLATRVPLPEGNEYEWLRTGSWPAPTATDPNARANVGVDQNGRERALTMAARILTRAGCVTDIADSMAFVNGRADTSPGGRYARWTTTGDVTVHPIGGSNSDRVSVALPGRVTAADEASWRTGGVELVSRVLTTPPAGQATSASLRADPSLCEIQRFLTALRGRRGDPWGVWTNDTCGLHVHVGRDTTGAPPSAFSPAPGVTVAGQSAALPLPVVQHLAYIVVQFEPLISALLPFSRRNLHTSRRPGLRPQRNWLTGMIASNLMGLRRSRHVCSLMPLPELHAIQARIFAEGQTVSSVARLMGDTGDGHTSGHDASGKYKFVNFARLIEDRAIFRHDVPATIEFRQHEGTVDYDDVAHWVLFVVGLVRAAQRMAQTSQPASPVTPPGSRSPGRLARELEFHSRLPFPAQQGNKYKVRCAKQWDEMQRLFDLVGLGRAERRYWVGRYAKFNPEDVVLVSADGATASGDWGLQIPGPSWTLGQSGPRVGSENCPVCVSETRQRENFERVRARRPSFE